MKTHYLKTWKDPFLSVVNEIKTGELRLNDRDFEVGDLMILQEYIPSTEKYTGLETNPLLITHLQEGFGLNDGYVMISFSAPKKGVLKIENELIKECKNVHCQNGTVEVVYGEPIRCSICDKTQPT